MNITSIEDLRQIVELFVAHKLESFKLGDLELTRTQYDLPPQPKRLIKEPEDFDTEDLELLTWSSR